MRFEFLFFIIA